MKKGIFVFAGLLILSVARSHTQGINFSELKGPYFGQKPPGMTPERFAPGIISTEAYDITPTFSPSLDEVFFGRRPTEQGSDNKIYYSKIVNGRWQAPTLASFSSGAMEFEAQISVDGKRVFFNRGKNLYVSDETGKGWGEARPIAAPADEGMCPAVAQNGNLYFTARRAKVYGIFRSIPLDGIYQNPEIVVPMAAHPFVAPDESFLVFDKYSFEKGAQTSKLYMSFRDGDGTWSEPIPFGNDINATGTELIAKVSPDGKYLFFQRKVEGNTDVYWVDAKILAEMSPLSRSLDRR